VAEVLAEVMVDEAKVKESGGATTVAVAALETAIAAVEMVPVVARVVPLAGATGASQRM